VSERRHPTERATSRATTLNAGQAPQLRNRFDYEIASSSGFAGYY